MIKVEIAGRMIDGRFEPFEARRFDVPAVGDVIQSAGDYHVVTGIGAGDSAGEGQRLTEDVTEQVYAYHMAREAAVADEQRTRGAHLARQLFGGLNAQ